MNNFLATLFENMIKQNSPIWNDCLKMFQGKSREEQIKQLKKLYKTKGMDLDTTAKQFGIQI